MKQQRRTFGQIVAEVEKSNSEALMKKARLANRLAKRARGEQRRTAYDVKASALDSLIHKMPARVDIRRDIILTDFVVIELRNTSEGLHFPASRL